MEYRGRFFDGKIDADSSQFRMVQLATTIYWMIFAPILIISLGRHFYLNEIFLSKFSYKIADAPGQVPSNPESQAFGAHYFGDYLLPHYWSELPNPWTSEIPVNYPPLAIEFFGIFGNFSYKLGLAFYLVMMVLSLAFVFHVALINRSLSTRIKSFITLGLLSGPFLISLDRGNVAGYSIGLLFSFGYFAIKQQWTFASISIAVLVSLKLYALPIFLIFVLAKKWKSLAIGIVISVSSLTLFLIPYPGSSIDTFNGFLHGLSGFSDNSDRKLYCYNHSFIGALIQLLHLSGNEHIAMRISAHAQVLSLIISAAFILLTFLFRYYLTIAIVLAFALMSVIVPISYGYTLTWAIAAICIVLYRANQIDVAEGKQYSWSLESDNSVAKEKKLLYTTIAYLTIILVPMPVALPAVNAFGCTTGVLPSVFFVLTVAWISIMLIIHSRNDASIDRSGASNL